MARDDARDQARAALCLAAAVVLAAWPGVRGDPRPCPEPRALAPRDGHTRLVTCHGGPGSAPVRGPARRLFGLRIDPNRADAATLESLPGIGPVRAAAIVRARRDAPFRGLADLERVPGIGAVTLARIAPALALPPGGRDRSGNPTSAIEIPGRVE